MSGDFLYVGMVEPDSLVILASRWGDDDTFDFTSVTDATMDVMKPSGTEETWSGVDLSAATTTGLVATHPFEAGDLDEIGKYRVVLNMTTASGPTRIVTQHFYVKEKYA